MCLCSPMPTTEHPTGLAVSPARVLLVENDFLIAETVADQLVELGYTVVGPAYSVTDACRLAVDEQIDAALLDWRLDRTDSSAVADLLLQRQIPFTFLTGYAEVADARYHAIPLLKKAVPDGGVRRCRRGDDATTLSRQGWSRQVFLEISGFLTVNSEAAIGWPFLGRGPSCVAISCEAVT